uniref:Uncharacterized protein n=1 Tax=Manihot esculenta TaxID=3983 RepID=A0A2C9WI89_MANES
MQLASLVIASDSRRSPSCAVACHFTLLAVDRCLLSPSACYFL